MKAYADVRKQLADQREAATPAEDLMPCMFCSVHAPRSVLSDLGARCQECYEQYKRLGYSGRTPPPRPPSAPWVKREAEAARERAAADAGGMPNAFVGLAAAMQQHKAQRDAIKGLSDDEVNAMLGELGS